MFIAFIIYFHLSLKSVENSDSHRNCLVIIYIILEHLFINFHFGSIKGRVFPYLTDQEKISVIKIHNSSFIKQIYFFTLEQIFFV